MADSQTCDRCGRLDFALIQTYQDARPSNDSAMRPILLCGFCLIHHCVPAYRHSRRSYEFGDVVDFASGKYCLCFGGNDREWVTLSPKPFDSYLDYCKSAHLADSQDSSTIGTPESTAIFRPPAAFHRPYQVGYHLPSHMNWYIRGGSHQRGSMALGMHEVAAPKVFSRLWTLEEDSLLRAAVDELPKPIRWADVARLVKSRTGKQCRERYFNHLKPNVRLAGWTPVEDAVLFLLYSRLGPKWSSIARLQPGRTDNSVKNRFHHVKRRMDKVITTSTTSKKMKEAVHEKLQKQGSEVQEYLDLGVPLVLCCLMGKLSEAAFEYDFEFGPMKSVTTPRLCDRCSMMIPSCQTGKDVCMETGWCSECIKAPPVLGGSLLRIYHELRCEEASVDVVPVL